MIMTGSLNSPSDGRLFASKGDAAPTQRPPLITAPMAGGALLPQPAPAARVEKLGGHRGVSPLSFLISRRPAVGSAPSGHGVGDVPAPAAPPLMLAAANPRSEATRARPPRRSLTLRLSVGHYLRFRECAVGGETTFQGLLEALVLRFLATADPLPPTGQGAGSSPRVDGTR
jgi:hypothetical protein